MCAEGLSTQNTIPRDFVFWVVPLSLLVGCGCDKCIPNSNSAGSAVLFYSALNIFFQMRAESTTQADHFHLFALIWFIFPQIHCFQSLFGIPVASASPSRMDRFQKGLIICAASH
jgi:hypothetical protein